MSQDKVKGRTTRQREAAIKAAAKGGQRDRVERRQSRKPAKKRGPVGRPDGPLARRRRVRTRLVLGLLVLLNVAAWFVWQSWSASFAVLIVSVITAPLLIGLLVRRR